MTALINWLLALAPIAAVLVLMIGFQWKASRAGGVGWIVALALAVLPFGAGGELLALAQVKSLLLSFYVLYIIWMALFFYHILNDAGVIASIGAGLPSLTSDRSMQAVLLGWTFASFLQGIAGFGVPTAVVAPLLIGLGFAPVAAAVIAGIGHAWAVTYGSLASSFLALVAASGRPPAELAGPAALMLGLSCFGCGLAVLWQIGGLQAIWRNGPAFVMIALAMSVVQYGVAVAGLYTLAAVSAGAAGLGVAVLFARRTAPLRASTGLGFAAVPQRPAEPASAAHPPDLPRGALPLRQAFAPYLLLVVVVCAAELIAPVNALLNSVEIQVAFPELRTALGYVTPAEAGRTISIFGHPGALLFYAGVINYLVLRRIGRYSPGAIRSIARKTIRGAFPSSIGIMAMVAMAVTMEHAGMTRLLAEGIGAVAGSAFPFVSPFVGALGAFMTGSNTNSNVVFAPLQQRAAELLDLSPALILAAQTTGGAIGSTFAPAKVIVGCSTLGIPGQEGTVLKLSLAYGLAIITGVGLATLGIVLLL